MNWRFVHFFFFFSCFFCLYFGEILRRKLPVKCSKRIIQTNGNALDTTKIYTIYALRIRFWISDQYYATRRRRLQTWNFMLYPMKCTKGITCLWFSSGLYISSVPSRHNIMTITEHYRTFANLQMDYLKETNQIYSLATDTYLKETKLLCVCGPCSEIIIM
jgi:hypothetical protein